MKKEKNFSETDFQKKALESLSDDEILQGFKDADASQYLRAKKFLAKKINEYLNNINEKEYE